MVEQAELVRLYRKRTSQTSGRRFLGLDYYDNHFHPHRALFPYLNRSQKERMLLALQEAHDLYYDQYILDRMEGRQYALAHDIDKLIHYRELMRPLHHMLQLDPWLQGNPLIFSHVNNNEGRDYSRVQALNDPITTANHIRFAYLWEGGLLQSGPLSPAWKNTFHEISLYSGTASFVFYFLRGGSTLMNRLKHITGSWGMTDEEKLLFERVGFFERMICQLNMDKYELLNDLVWGPANWACFLWYNTLSVYHFLGFTLSVGSKDGRLLEFGNVLTVALFCMDFISSLCQCIEAYLEHQRYMAVLIDEKDVISDNHGLNHQKQKQIAHYAFEYKYKQCVLYTELAYSLALVIGFSIMVGVLSNPLTLSAGIVGSLMCSGASLIKDWIKHSIALEKACEEQWFIHQKQAVLLHKWREEPNLQANGNHIIIHEHRFLEEAFVKKQAEIDLAWYKRSFGSVLGITRPAVLWSAMMFCPWNQAVIIVASALLVAYVAYQYLIRYQERCMNECELVTDECQITKNIAYYLRTEDRLTYIDKRQGIHQDISAHLNAFNACTQANALNTAYQFFYALVTLAPLFSNVDTLMDELSQFSSSRRLTDDQLKKIKSQVIFELEPQDPALTLAKPAPFVIRQSESRGLFWKPWNLNVSEADNFMYCQLP